MPAHSETTGVYGWRIANHALAAYTLCPKLSQRMAQCASLSWQRGANEVGSPFPGFRLLEEPPG